jgi:hypothetical protein
MSNDWYLDKTLGPLRRRMIDALSCWEQVRPPPRDDSDLELTEEQREAMEDAMRAELEYFSEAERLRLA